METSFSIPCPPFEVKLSHWDRVLPPTHSKRILCFSLPTNVDKQQVADFLHIAFHHTVQRFPLLAGSVVPFAADAGGRPWLRNIVPHGAARLIINDVSSELSFATLAKANFSQHLLKTEQLCPLPEVGYFKDERVDVCSFQANFIEGGLLLVVSIIHNAADGRGVTEIIKTFADELRKAQAGETKHPLETRSDMYRSDRTQLVSGNGVPGVIENHAAWTSSPSNAHAHIHNVENACRTFRIRPKALSLLKEKLSASSKGPDDWFSTNDAISGFIWRSIMVARHRAGILDHDAICHVAQPLDCRSHLGISEPYIGNTIYMVQSSMPLSVLSDAKNGFAAAARAMRAEIKAMTGDKFRDLIGYAERTAQDAHTRLKVIEHMATSGIILTSLFKMDIHSMDFGPLFDGGHIKALRLPARGTQAGAAIVLPRVPDGTCEFMVTEQESTLECLSKDPFFCQFTEDEDSVVEAPEETPTSHPQAGDNVIQTAVPIPSRLPAHDVATAQIQDLGPVQANIIDTLSTLVVSSVKAQHVGTIKIVQLQRESAKNSISRQMLEELSQVIEDIHYERDVGGTRALVLASAVDDVFSAGADLKERKRMSLGETQSFLTRLRAVFARLATLPIPTIACVSGRALGGGFELALCCHFRVFSSDAVVALPETRLAIIPGAGGTYRLPKIVGPSHALDLILTGRLVRAREASSMGLCNRLVAADPQDDSLSPTSKRVLTLAAGISLAQEISKSGPIAVRAAISALTYSCEAVENAAYESVLSTKDRYEALEAFSEKRKPILIGE